MQEHIQCVFPVEYSNAVDCGVVLITTEEHAVVLTYSCTGPFFVRLHFTQHEVLLREGEKWGKTKQKVLHIYE